jgi:hypothetical protein
MGNSPDPGENATAAASSPSGAVPHRILIGGMVAYNEERNLEAALGSLLGQELLPGWRWGSVWVVASGCTDRTVEIAQRAAVRDPRVRVVVEAERGGKARALGEIIRRASGDALVLLNSDARADPGSVAELLRTAEGHAPPFAVMGRPFPAHDRHDLMSSMLRLLWHVHDEFHRETLAHGEGTHLSDELLLLSLPVTPAIPDGVINDGSFFGAWLTRRNGSRLYAPLATVETETPDSLRDHLTQRRRILVGHRQITQMVGVAPSALRRYVLAHPGNAVSILRRTLRSGQHRLRDFLLLGVGEMCASTLAAWDRLPPAKDHVRWRRISSGADMGSPDGPTWSAGPLSPASPGSTATTTPGSRAFIDLRVEILLDVARQFGTGVPLEELSYLLPQDGPSDVEDLRRWLDARPDLARVEGNRAFPPAGRPDKIPEREKRGAEYRRAAERLVDLHLRPVLPWVRCVGITGSAAYGAPQAGDDLDLFVVTRAGSLWVFLAYTYVAVRVGFRPAAGTNRPPPCFNYVLDDRQALAEFGEARGFLFAREALTAQIFRGESYYQDLLASAPWLGNEIPRLYAKRTSGVPASREPPVPLAIRLVNASLFPLIATYLQLAGLRRNARMRSQHARDGTFRTVTGPGRLAFISERFDRLRADLAPASLLAPEEHGMAGPSRIPSAR